MRRNVLRSGLWLRMTAGLAILAAGGVAFAWWWGRRVADPGLEAASAYADGDWSRAAELARRWLKAAPSDAEALRLLARSTARLGRDGPANALFARLGSSALQAEDLFLLGLGLDRAGQKDDAARAWEKALGLDPDHAATIEQLVIRDTAQNRLAEAAQLAERLARRPGWELRGELDLGALRAEVGAPAGAAAVLGRALERPEAASLDHGALALYRKLLARCLLRTSRPAEARGALEMVQKGGADREASWLISRAALQEGSIAEAAAALEAAGSYRAEHPLEPEPGPYVGEAGCITCHPDQGRALRASRHSATLLRGEQLARLPYPTKPVVDPGDATVTHEIRLDGDVVRFQSRIDSKLHRAIVEYAFGAPDRYTSLVGRDEAGRLLVLRLSRYDTGSDSGWVRTTGHSEGAGGGEHFLGKPLESLDGIERCLFCHATNARAVLAGTGPEASDRAIGCERCHGPGRHHVLAIAAKLPDPAIVSPATAPAEDRLRICGQCHSHHQELNLPRTDPFWIRFQGTTLPWSRCYTESPGAFDCTTCHDAHHDADRSLSRYDGICLSCHGGGQVVRPADRPAAGTSAVEGRPRGRACPVSAERGCTGCHMPAFESKPLHATFTDHYIRIHPQRR
jgi:tetratricopeptide (TPR) repeat protein